jgi:glycosyltransferase involved in cell wall biosynthesis
VIGVNLFGDLTGQGSLSETARTTANALSRQGIAFTYNELLLPYAMYREGVVDAPINLPKGVVYPVNLFCYNVHLFSGLATDWLTDVRTTRYTVGLWVWEMPAVPEVWHGEFDKVDEVWCPSTFVQRSFQNVTRDPVIVVPHPIELLPQTRRREEFGLDDGRSVFLFSFSAAAGEARKNPWSVIEAYNRAFGGSAARDKPLLLIKIQHSADYPKLVAALTRALDSLGGHTITETYSRQKMHDLYYNIDCYVSLHRAEGFGLGLAEAMAAAKPVIATAYSGPCDFLRADNSYRVDYQLRPVISQDLDTQIIVKYSRLGLVDAKPGAPCERPEAQPRCGRIAQQYYYRPGMVWADADVTEAAAHMVAVYEHPEEARAKGVRAAEHINAYFSPEAVGRIMERRVRRACRGT